MGYRVDSSDSINIHQAPTLTSGYQQQRRRAKDKSGQVWDASAVLHIEELLLELFHLHDLNGNGVLEEIELVKLNEKIALLHHGKDAEISKVRDKYLAVFRTQLDPNGNPVPYEKFRTYAREVVHGLDKDPEAQEMILEQFVAEALSARQAFNIPFLVDASELTFESNQAWKNKPIQEAHHVMEASTEVILHDKSFDAPFWRSIANAPNSAKWL